MDSTEPVTAQASEPVTGKTMSRVVAIRTYFLSDMTATEALAQIKPLTEADRDELARGAAIELGVTLI